MTIKEKAINYIMSTPYNTNWAVLSSMLGEGDWDGLKEYVKTTPYNMNRNVLGKFFEDNSGTSAIVGSAIVGKAVI